MVASAIEDHVRVVQELAKQGHVLTRMARELKSALHVGGKLLLCGNGGSAADCQHIAAELVGRFRRERAPLPALALTTDTSVLTAVGNDYGYDDIFSRQVLGLMLPEDVLLCISTSGKSANVVAAAEVARSLGALVLAFTGQTESPLSAVAHVTLRVPSTDTARIQECHILAGHILCELLENSNASGVDEWLF
jgi:D-sedoheptulose 7-phosphate isomerase